MTKRIITLLSLLILLCITDAHKVFGQTTYVVAVGLGSYKYPEIAPSLPCSVDDAKALAHFFHDYNGSKVFMLLDENATRPHILRVLEQEFSKSGPNDEIIFAFSGHGVQGGLTCYETKDINSIISYNEIQNIMKKAKARRKIILAMACYSGGLTLKKTSNNPYKRKTEKTDVMLYTSSRSDEVSWENSYMKNSYFVKRILEGFDGAADINNDRKITARELFNYVNPKVISDTKGRQHPQMWGSFDDGMVVVYVK